MVVWSRVSRGATRELDRSPEGLRRGRLARLVYPVLPQAQFAAGNRFLSIWTIDCRSPC